MTICKHYQLPDNCGYAKCAGIHGTCDRHHLRSITQCSDKNVPDEEAFKERGLAETKRMYAVSCNNGWLQRPIWSPGPPDPHLGLLGYLVRHTNYDRILMWRSSNNGFKSVLLLLIIIFGVCINNAGGEILHHRKNLNVNMGEKQALRLMPSFLKVPDTVEVMSGQTVILSCKVQNLEDRMVLWMRTSDLVVLTVGDITFTHDQRFQSEFPHGGEESWGLTIKNVQHKDAGRYECQINTEPKMKRYVTLAVKDMQQMDTPYYGTSIAGGNEQIVKVNSTVSLTCKSTLMGTHQSFESDQAMMKVSWLKDGEVLNGKKSRSSLYIETEWNFPTVTSKLILATVSGDDTGIYTCATAAGRDSVQVYVIEDGKVEPFQSSSNSLAHNGAMIGMLTYSVLRFS